ncbi:hypothetical protein NKR19_g8958 [Coniochaeta hoffmannii]|uniref:Uncharacterized protein n=1 Tax=Coniochaeta hoffmannii TaxID=91930 RepID=A0AA38RCN7_9PEZI|nr:hypothetical protein NKR19_g8958 [Coniochaeta hoffmannii]
MSLPAASTSSTTADTDGGAEPSLEGSLEGTRSWEEPHPGVPIPLQERTGTQGLSRLPSEAWSGDMAAKGYGYVRNKPGVARRYARPAMRPRLVRSETACITRKVRFGMTPSPGESTLCPTPALSSVNVDANEDTDMTGSEGPSPLYDYRPLSLDLSQFSEHMNKAFDGVRFNSSSLTVCEIGPYTQAAPEADLYGWEAELNRKLLQTECLKRNLLQRVFSLGDVRLRSE